MYNSTHAQPYHYFRHFPACCSAVVCYLEKLQEHPSLTWDRGEATSSGWRVNPGGEYLVGFQFYENRNRPGLGMVDLNVDDHPLLDLRAFVTTFSSALGELASQSVLTQFLSLGATAPLASSDDVRSAVRDLLRYGGFKPTGRSKPASEYLLKAAREGTLSTINVAVDVCNAVSLHSGLPISVVDLDVAREPFRVAVAPQGATYVFNPSGQTMDIAGLLCLFDSDGPCGNAVKDSQRTKTSAATRRTLSLIWGTKSLLGRCEETEQWYHDLLESHGATVEPQYPCWR